MTRDPTFIETASEEFAREEPADRRVRLDPPDAKNSRHLPQCEYVSVTDPAVLKILLKVKPGMGDGYDWVERRLRRRLAGSALRRERRVIRTRGAPWGAVPVRPGL